MASNIQKLIAHFAALPGIGQKTAERLVFHLLKIDKNILADFGQALTQLQNNIRHCALCGQFSETEWCAICADKRRDHAIICVVAEQNEISALEKSGQFSGVYHILHGILNPIEGIVPEKLNIKSLLERIVTPCFSSDQSGLKAGVTNKINVKEIILALNPTIEGETTSLYLTKLIKKTAPLIKITRLGRGLPQGGDLEYADEITLANAFKGRTVI
jgi:recombination protein RecR